VDGSSGSGATVTGRAPDAVHRPPEKAREQLQGRGRRGSHAFDRGGSGGAFAHLPKRNKNSSLGLGGSGAGAGRGRQVEADPRWGVAGVGRAAVASSRSGGAAVLGLCFCDSCWRRNIFGLLSMYCA